MCNDGYAHERKLNINFCGFFRRIKFRYKYAMDEMAAESMNWNFIKSRIPNCMCNICIVMQLIYIYTCCVV